MSHPLTSRFIECHQILKERGDVRTNKEFAEALDYLPQGLSEILNGRRDVSIDLMTKAVERYNINPVYLTLGTGPRFLNENSPSGLQILSVVTDSENRERIVHVPIAAQAGYAQELDDPAFLEDLPTYNLPAYDFSQGTFRSFDVEGDSMYPTLYNGDRVICQYVNPNYWTHSIKGNHVYVIVTTDGVVVKRVKNRMALDQSLVICSDNQAYESYEMSIGEVKEVWKVEYVLKRFDHFKGAISGDPAEQKFEELKRMLMGHQTKILTAIRDIESVKTVRELLG